MRKYTLRHGYRRSKLRLVALGIPVFVIGLTLLNYINPPTSYSPTNTARLDATAQVVEPPKKQHAIETPLPWPTYGQSAYGINSDGVLAQSKEAMEPVPIASLAKVITALAVLDKKPLAPGEQGPMITITEEDEELFRDYIAKDGTVVPVKAGTQISQYQALQATLLPSANNVSDTLARWAFGSVDAYAAYANKLLKEQGISDTTIADASGYSPLTTSTAADMVKIGILYMQQPLLQEIAQQSQATIPFAGIVQNYNASINQNGIIGIKVGFTEEAGRTFLVADLSGEDKNEVAVVAVLGADNMPTAMRDAERLLMSGKENQVHIK